MTPLFCCGFECGVGHWTLSNANVTISTVNPRTGLRSLRCNASAASSNTAFISITAGTIRVVRFYIYFTTLPNADCDLAMFRSSPDYAGLFYKTSDTSLYAGTYNGTTIAFGSTGVPVTTGKWYLIDVRANCTSNPWLVDVNVNGVACGQKSSAITAGSFNLLQIAVGVTITTDLYIDDLVLSSDTNDYPIGAGSVRSYVPNADGTHTSTGTNIVKGTTAAPTGGGAITSATTDAFNRVNARPLGGGATDATFLINQQTTSAAQYAEVDFESTTETSPPRAVEVITVDRQASTATGSFQTKLNDNGTEDVIINRSVVAGSTSDRYVTKQYGTMVGGGAWTLARFNALKVRFGYSGDAAPDQYWRGVMIEAEFVDRIPNKIISLNQSVKRSNYY